MDRLISTFPAARDRDLMLCLGNGVAYQADMKAGRVPYNDAYLAKVEGYEGGEISRRVNAGRCDMLDRHLHYGAHVLDIGSGSGAFVRAAAERGYVARGWDVMPGAVARLRAAGLYSDYIEIFEAVTMWDAIEHMEEPGRCLNRIEPGDFLFVSIPVFSDLRKVRQSKHYRPGEHLYYWTERGFVAWAMQYGFRLLERSQHETDAGRESIGAFAFRRDLPLKSHF